MIPIEDAAVPIVRSYRLQDIEQARALRDKLRAEGYKAFLTRPDSSMRYGGRNCCSCRHLQGREPMITNSAASAAILAHCEAGTIVQRAWHGRDAEGRAVACLLGAIDPSVTATSDCNAELMPMWLAELTPVLFDGLPPEIVYPIARRYGVLVARWDRLSAAQWNDVLTAFLVYTIAQAVDAARPTAKGKPYWSRVVAACERSKAAIRSDGDKRAAGAAEAAAGAAEAAAWAARAAEAAGAAYKRLFAFLLDQIEAQLGAE